MSFVCSPGLVLISQREIEPRSGSSDIVLELLGISFSMAISSGGEHTGCLHLRDSVKQESERGQSESLQSALNSNWREKLGDAFFQLFLLQSCFVPEFPGSHTKDLLTYAVCENVLGRFQHPSLLCPSAFITLTRQSATQFLFVSTPLQLGT